MAERHARLLAELAEIGMAAARELGAAIAEAEAPEQKSTLASALHKVSRSVRQSIFLEARLVRDQARIEKEAKEAAREETKRKVERRRGQLQASVKRQIWNEHEADVAERLESVLEDLVGEAACFDDFLTDPLEDQIARLCRDLGLDLPPQDQPNEEDPEAAVFEFDAAQPPDRPSSA